MQKVEQLDGYQIVAMQASDWNQIQRIYAQGLASGIAAFMTSAPSWDTWNDNHLSVGRRVALGSDDQILGWSALTPVPDT